MSNSKGSVILIDDDEKDNISSRNFPLSSYSQTNSSTGRHLGTKSKSLPSKTSSKASSTKRPNSWISSSFDGFASLSSSDSASKKRKTFKQKDLTDSQGFSSQSIKTEISTNLWIDKYQPKTETELAVHKKKIEEVRSWLLEHLCGKSNGILLLNGPVGVGKTATVLALSKELDFELQEWINPTTTTDGFIFGNEYAQSQFSQFQDFLLRSNKYPTLSIFGSHGAQTGQRKVILLEDLPNLFYRDAKKFHEVLMEYKQKGCCPLVLIISDSSHDDSNIYKLLPKTIHAALGISTISFNPVAITSLQKTLNRILSLESKTAGKGFSMPSKDVVNELAQNCAGDIRTAINALQFTCQRGVQADTAILSSMSAKSSKKKDDRVKKPQQPQNKKSTKGKLTNKEDKEDISVKAIGGKDTTLFLFRALGKILYCKRDVSQTDRDLLPNHMTNLARNTPQFDPEDVVERAHLSDEMLCLYLHQNYLDFFTDIENVVSASEYLSDANMMSAEWTHRTSLLPYMSCITTRGLMFSHCTGTNTAPSRGGWRPLHKPQWFDVSKKARNNNRIAKDLFQEQSSDNNVLHTQLLPFLALTDVPLRTPGQISFVQQMGRYQRSRSTYRSHTDTLDEKDCGESGDDEPTNSQNCQRSLSASQGYAKNSGIAEGESVLDGNLSAEVLIEDFDDDW